MKLEPTREVTPLISSKSDITIGRPIEEVYEVLADATNDPQWCPPVKECRQISTGNGVTRYEAQVKPGPRRLTNRFELRTEKRPNRIDWTGSNEMGDFDGHYLLREVDGGTHVEMVSNLDIHGPMKLLSPVMAALSRANARDQCERLKQLLEQP